METSDSNEKPISLRCEYTVDEVRRSVAYLTGKQRRIPSWVRWLIAVCLLLLVAWVSAGFSFDGLRGMFVRGWRSVAFSAPVLLGAYFIVIYVAVQITRRLLFKRHARRSKIS